MVLAMLLSIEVRSNVSFQLLVSLFENCLTQFLAAVTISKIILILPEFKEISMQILTHTSLAPVAVLFGHQAQPNHVSGTSATLIDRGDDTGLVDTAVIVSAIYS